MSNNNIFLIGTRGSRLALTQAEMIRKKISEVLKLETCVLKTIQTQGDKATHETTLVENKVLLPGIFTRELDSALLAGKIDAAVHSLKDVPTELPINIQYGFFDLREDHHDVLISKNNLSLLNLPRCAKIGTSSPRRKAQLLSLRKDFQVFHLRGNIDTRLRQLQSENELDGIVVAAAGMKRLNYQHLITEYLDDELFIPSPAQGTLCVLLKSENSDMKLQFKSLNHMETELCSLAERSFLSSLGGGCRAPIGALAKIKDNTICLNGMLLSLDGARTIHETIARPITEANQIGSILASQFFEKGAQDLLNYE
jgi:hydroxymethylbilane synthase